MVKSKLVIVLSLVSGLALALSLPFFSWGWLSFFAFIPLFLVLASLKNQSQAFKTGYLTGLVYFSFTFRWFWDTYPLSALGIESHLLAFFLILPVWLLTALGMALFWGGGAWLIKKIEPHFNWTALLVIPSTFTFVEYLRSFFLSLLWFAPETTLGPHWTSGNLAYALHNSPTALYFSSWLGIYGLTFIIVLINVLFLLILEHKRVRTLAITAGLVLLVTYLPSHYIFNPRHIPNTVSVAVIQTNTPSRPTPIEQLSSFRKQLELLDEVGRKWPAIDAVIFPEGSNFFTSLSLFGNSATLGQYFIGLFPSSTLILDNAKTAENGYFKSKSIALDSKRGIVGYYNKYLLTPNGEFVPSLIRRFDKLLGLNSTALQTVEEFQRGESYPPIISLAKFSFRPLICSDVAAPLLSRTVGWGSAAPKQSDVITVQASFAFANGSQDLARHTQAMAQFRAAENQKSLVFASNAGPSFILLPSGQMLRETQKSGFEILTGPLVLNSKRSLYNKIGDGPIVMASLCVSVLSFFWREKKKRK